MNINNGLYESLFKEMLNAFAHCRAIYNIDGKMVDWVYIRVNNSFIKQTGLPDVNGRTVSVVIPTLLKTNPGMFEKFQSVAQGKGGLSWEEYVPSLRAWFDIRCYSVEENTFTTIFDNITLRRKTHRDLEIANEQILTAFVMSLQKRDLTTKEHATRTTELTSRFTTFLGMDEKEVSIASKGALLHDVGKIGVPDAILRKTGRLTKKERLIMQRHPNHAYEILSHIKYLKSCLDIPYCHHEAWDGNGYPRGLKGKKIPFLARMFSVIDVYDAMTSDRPYRKAFGVDFVLKYIEEQGGKLFDPFIVTKFLEMMKNE